MEIYNTTWPQTEAEVWERIRWINFCSSDTRPAPKYFVNHDLSVTITGDFFYGNMKACEDTKRLPFKINLVGGSLDLSALHNLETLDGCPKIICGYFNCSNTAISVIDNLPKGITNFYAGGCRNLNFLPPDLYSGVECCILMRNTPLKSLIGVTENIKTEYFSFSADNITEGGLGLVLNPHLKNWSVALHDTMHKSKQHAAFEIIYSYFGKPDLLFECQQKLIENGLEEFAIL